ncbi:MAG: NarK/NasA family nitrate transporter [Deltaproteobacteria bacterium]|nr:NarK/NasA family nitrate transporter [Deltaproteobacteria bacterium]
MSMKGFWKSGHPPTLLMALLYFDMSFMVWMVNAAMAPFISQEFNLSPAEKGFMLSIPVFAGAFFRIPLGLVAEMIGRKTAALIGLSITLLAMLYGFYFVNSFTEVLIMGGVLGVAGASFAVALPLGAGWFPPSRQGLAMGIAGAGNSGTIFAGLFAPPLAKAYGWNAVYGYFAIPIALVMILMWFFAKEPPDKMEKKSATQYLKVLGEKDIWVFNILYWVTFGGYVGFSSFMPTFMADQYGVSKVSAGQFMIIIGFTASAVRVLGGWFSDRFGGIHVLTGIYVMILVGALGAATLPSMSLFFIFLIVMAGGMGMGNGSVFQLLPLRFPYAKAITAGIVGEFGALGGAFIPMVMGYSMNTAGTYAGGFIVYGLSSIVALGFLLFFQRRWTTSWVGKGGKALASEETEEA